MRKVSRLTTRQIASITKPGRYADGAGLELQVSRSGTKSWLFRYCIRGIEHRMGLGSIHTVSLKEARERARQARLAILDGNDPLNLKRKSRADAAKEITFRDAAEMFCKAKLMGFRNATHRHQWRVTLEAANAVIGNVNINDVDTSAVLRVLRPLFDSVPTRPGGSAIGWSASLPGASPPAIAGISRTLAGGKVT